MGELVKLPNIGKKMEDQLNQVGIHTAEELRNTGAKDAWLMIQQMDSSACMLRLMALEGAVQNMNKNLLADEVKADLKAFYHEHKLKK